MSSALQDAVNDAHISWLCNATTADARWKLKQLHGLHQLLLTNRDELIAALTRKSSPAPVLLERELALLVQDLAAHIENVKKETSAKPARPIATPYGAASTSTQPLGVSLLLSGSSNPFRYALAPLASSIVAGNVVVLANVVVNSTAFFSVLQREMTKYMDSFSIHVLPHIRIPDQIPSQVNHVAVFDDSPEEFVNILSAENAVFYSSRPGYNLAVVDEGKHSLIEIARQVLDSSPTLQLPGDALSAIFIRQEEMAALCTTLTGMSEVPVTPSTEITPEVSQVSGITPLTSHVFTANLAEHVSGQKNGGDLSELLDLVQSEGLMAVIQYTSLDQVLDSIGKLSAPIQQVALLSPLTKTSNKYFENWTKSSVVIFGSVGPLIPSIISDLSAINKDKLLTIFPSSAFARPRAIFNSTPASTLAASILSSPTSTIDMIRRSYEGRITPLLPEPRGERIGFFSQVEYVFKGVAATVGVAGLVGLWFGGKAVKRYFDHR